jgi:hypothetical protein
VLLDDLGPDVVLDVGAHDEDDGGEAGGQAVLDRQVEDGLVPGPDPGQLLDPSEAAAQPGGHDHQQRSFGARSVTHGNIVPEPGPQPNVGAHFSPERGLRSRGGGPARAAP